LSDVKDKGIDIMIDMLKIYAKILNTMAEVEETTGKKIDELQKEVFSPATFVELSKKVPPEVFGEFMADLLKLSTLISTYQNPFTLPAEEKKKVASELQEIAESLEEIKKKIGWDK
jgi:hypothetical protein